ncbi:MAG TPA: phosphoenolpyruvate--protein phosphotransferase [Jatrophihabitans sp.]|nr:phosphoenolpyruvate--protein phosphotransferase [Jatrophihabitans sp.]
MVGIVVVSHSRALARAATELAGQMVHGTRPAVAIAAGLDETTLGTDAVQVKEAIERVDSGDGVVVLLDLGSAVLSAELALDLLDDDLRERVVLSPAPLVEGLVAAVVTAVGGGTAAEVAAEAADALAGKQAHLTGSVVPTAAAPRAVDARRGVFVVHNAHGLHARPAARLVAQVRTLDAHVELTNLTTGAGPVPASSLSRVATLAAQRGHEIEVTITGSQAAEALEQILALAGRQFDEDEALDSLPVPASTTGPIAASPGIAIGRACRLEAGPLVLPEDEPGDDAARWRRLREAIAATRRDIARTRAQVAREVGEADASIFDAHLMLLDDPELLAHAQQLIKQDTGPARAWDTAVRRIEAELSSLPDSYLRGRAADVRAVGDQVLRYLLGVDGGRRAAAGILVATDLTPAEAAELDAGVISAVVLAFGSPTSHAAILARARGIPLLVAAGAAVQRIRDGQLLVVDADGGNLLVDPEPDVRADYEQRISVRERAHAAAVSAAALPAVTEDGVAITVCANVGSIDDAKNAADGHADGSGLVRTEFLFQSRSEPPSVGEQEAMYRSICDAFGQRRVVFRTLDAGGDKPVPFASVAHEANPFLGVRGIRLSLHYRGLLRDQLRALCAVAAEAPVSVMFPMVTNVAEVREANAVLDEACDGRRPVGLRVGIMVEVPSVALKAAAFAPHVDFFSIGTNDLTQYALAAERGNPALATFADPLDPGVLRLVAELCAGAGAVPVSVCGEAAADPAAIPMLLGLGARTLSVPPPAIASVKQVVRDLNLGEAGDLARRALALGSAAEVRSMS